MCITGTKLWQEFSPIDRPLCLPAEDRCFFARDYTARGGFEASEANSLIANLKKRPSHKGTPQWRHKELAIVRFASELSTFLPEHIHVAAIPSSRIIGDPEYDTRLEDVLEELQRSRPDIIRVQPIERVEPIPAQHEREERASIEEIKEGLRWRGLPCEINHLVLIDDVVTVGRTYAACRRIILENTSGVRTSGVFWARTVWPD